MKGTIKLGVMVLMAGILFFSPFIAFAEEAGEVTGEEMTTESQAGSSKEGKVGLENPDPTSSPLAEAYRHRVSGEHPEHPEVPRK